MTLGTKNPSTTWFFTNWENDEALMACSLAAQGLWKRLLCIAARSPEPGIVLIGSLDTSYPAGLPHLAAAVGRSPEEIAPLIDELLSSGAAGIDRRKRLYNRRMVRQARVSAARAGPGRKGAEVTNGNRWGKVDLGRQNVGKGVGKSSPSSSLQDSQAPPHESHRCVAPRDSSWVSDEERAKWQPRLDGYRPWDGVHDWSGTWGRRPDAPGDRNLVPEPMLAEWRAKRAVAMKELEARQDG